jgi:urease subunit gamma
VVGARAIRPDRTAHYNPQFQQRDGRLQLTPRETEKLLIYVAADLARRRRGRGLKLNLPEATALITEAMLEGARDGRRVSEVRALGRQVLTRDDVMDEVPELLTVVHVEATFPDGTKLISCHDPIP